MRACFGPNKLDPLPNQCLSRKVCRMRLSCNNELYRLLCIGQYTQETCWVMQKHVRSFIRGKAPGKP